MARGGYQKPSNPAPVSGPGALSRRTDGGGAGQPQQRLANAAYGEQKNFQEIQAGAMMNDSAQQTAPSAAQQMPEIIPLGAPTQRPDEPVTTGSPIGPGPGPEVMGMSMGMKGQSSIDAQSLGAYLPSLERTASMPGTPPSFIRFVRYLRSQQNV